MQCIMTSRYSSDTTSLVWKCSPNLFSYLVIVVIYVWWSSTGPNVTVFDFRDVKYELICHCGGSCKNCIIIRSFWRLREHSSIRTYTNTAEMQCINEFSNESGTILAWTLTATFMSPRGFYLYFYSFDMYVSYNCISR